jgi:hypothetical protein
MPRPPSATGTRLMTVCAMTGALLVAPSAATSASESSVFTSSSRLSSSGVSRAPAVASHANQHSKSQIPCATPHTIGAVASSNQVANKAAAKGMSWILGSFGESKRQATRQDRREQRQSTRQDRREQRQYRREQRQQ